MGAAVSGGRHELVVRSVFAADGARRAGPVADGDIVVASHLRVECLPALRCVRTIAVYRAAVETFRDAAVGGDIVTSKATFTGVEIPRGVQELDTPMQTEFARMVGRNDIAPAVLSGVAGLVHPEHRSLAAGYPVLADGDVCGNGNVELIATMLVNASALVLHMIDATPEAAMGTLLGNVDDTRMIVAFVLGIMGGGCVYNLGGQARFDSRGPVDDMLGIRKDCDGMATSTCTAVAALLKHGSAVLDELAARARSASPAREASAARGASAREGLREVAAAVVAYLWATTATAGMAFLLARTPGFGDGHSDLDRSVHDTKSCVEPFGHAVAVLVPLKPMPTSFKKGTAGGSGGAYAAIVAKAKTLRSIESAKLPLVVESTAAMADKLVGDVGPSGVVTLMPNADGVYTNVAKGYGALLKTGESTVYGPDGTPVQGRWAEAASLGGLVTAGSYKMCRPYYTGSYMQLWVLYLGDRMVTDPAFEGQPFHDALRKAAAPAKRLLTQSLNHGYERQPCGTVTPHMAALAAARTRRLHPGHPPAKLVELGPLPRRRADNAFVVTLSPFDADHIAAAPADRLFAIDGLNYALINAPHPAYTRLAPLAPAPRAEPVAEPVAPRAEPLAPRAAVAPPARARAVPLAPLASRAPAVPVMGAGFAHLI